MHCRQFGGAPGQGLLDPCPGLRTARLWGMGPVRYRFQVHAEIFEGLAVIVVAILVQFLGSMASLCLVFFGFPFRAEIVKGYGLLVKTCLCTWSEAPGSEPTISRLPRSQGWAKFV